MKMGGTSYGGGSYGGSPMVGRKSAPGAYGGGSGGGGGGSRFIMNDNRGGNSQCPPGYSTARRGRGVNQVIVCTPLPVRIPPPVPRAPAPVVNTQVDVSPSFQQQYTPQFSPTMQQQQDSPGASQAAAPEQNISTPQSSGAAPPSGESETTIALREELERMRLINLINDAEQERAGARAIISQPEDPRIIAGPQIFTEQEPIPLQRPVGVPFMERARREASYNTEHGVEASPDYGAADTPKKYTGIAVALAAVIGLLAIT